MRRTVQMVSLAFFTYLFIRAHHPLTSWIPVDLFLRADPLIALTTILSSKNVTQNLFTAGFLAGLTILLGRFFCGYLCPLGALLDLGQKFLPQRRLRHHFNGLRVVKYHLLFILLVASLLGAHLVYLLDPLVILTRTYTLVLYPLVVLCANASLDGLRPLFHSLGLIKLSYLSYHQPLFYTSLLSGIIFITVVGLNWITPRFWCRYLCPLGALLAFLARYNIFKRVVKTTCTACMRCRERCPMEALGVDPKEVKVRECILCRTCVHLCPEKAILFKPILSPFREEVSAETGITRRGFLCSLLGGAATSFFIVNNPLKQRRRGILIRPPGAIPEEDFLNTCIRCTECMKVCVTNTLQPALLEAGLEGLFAPRLDLRYAPCEQTCNLCGKVCPTQAIRTLLLEEKKHAKIGTAMIIKEKCLVWEQDKVCLICDEQCPYNAIVFKTVEGVRRPFVMEYKCNGCGFCEHKCPVEGDAAIVVTPLGELRLREGSYREEAKRYALEFKEDSGYDQFFSDSN